MSLKIAFWGYYVGGLFAIAVYGNLITIPNVGFSILQQAYLFLFLYFLALVVIPLLMVGTWRCASTHRKSGGKKVWSILAKICVLAPTYNLCRILILLAIPSVPEFVKAALGDKGTPAYKIEVIGDGEALLFSGGLRVGAEGDFKKALSNAPKVRAVTIHSDGGRRQVGMEIGRIIREAGLDTYVTLRCTSAATFMFVSGKRRIIESGAKIGFHQPTRHSWDVNGRNDDDVFKFMMRASISEDFIKRVLATNPDVLWYPSYDEMFDAGVVTIQMDNGEIVRTTPRPIRRDQR